VIASGSITIAFTDHRTIDHRHAIMMQ